MLIASLVEFAIAKPRIRQEHNVQSANFDIASLRVTATDATAIGGICSLKQEMHRWQLVEMKPTAPYAAEIVFLTHEFPIPMEIAHVTVRWAKRAFQLGGNP